MHKDELLQDSSLYVLFQLCKSMIHKKGAKGWI
jgi:hypothetical protein